MNYLIMVLVAVCTIFTSIPSVADRTEDEAAIREVIEQSIAAFNRHDAKALYSSSIEETEDWSGTQKGRAALENSIAEWFEQQKAIQEKQKAEIGIIFVTNDVAIYKFNLEHTGMIDGDGNPLPPSQSLIAFVFVKKDGRWLKVARFASPIEQQP